MSTPYDKYIQSLQLFMNKQPLSTIRFLYFNASDMTQPKMKDTFRKFMVDSTNCYIIGGKDKNYLYVYNESTIKYLVNVKLKTGLVYDVDILNSGPQYDVNHGDHIDFGIIRLISNDIIVKTHKTVYTNLGNFVFDRSFQVCNFKCDETKFKDESKFDSIKCVSPNNTICGDINKVYQPFDRHIIRTLCHIMSSQPAAVPGGRRKQSGGTDLHNKPFWQYFTQQLSDIRDDILEIRVIDDKSSKSNNIVILIDFEDYKRSVLIIPKQNMPNEEFLKQELSKLKV